MVANDINDGLNESTVSLSSRVNMEDKGEFIRLSKELGVPQHETFRKMIEVFKKMNSLDTDAPGRQAQSEELQGHFKRMVEIFCDVLTSNENIRSVLVEQQIKEIGEKEKIIDSLRLELDNCKTNLAQTLKDIKQAENEVSLMNNRISEFHDSEIKSSQIIDGLKKIELDQTEKINSLNGIIADTKNRDALIEKECGELGMSVPQLFIEYRRIKQKFDEVDNAYGVIVKEIADKNAIINQRNNELSGKVIEINSFKQQCLFYVTEIDGIKKEHRDSIAELKSENRQEVALLKEEMNGYKKELAAKDIIINQWNNEAAEKDMEISNLKQHNQFYINEIDTIKKNNNEDIVELKNENKQSIASYKEEIQGYKKELSDLNFVYRKDIEEAKNILRTELDNKYLEIVKTKDSRISELNQDIHSKDVMIETLNKDINSKVLELDSVKKKKE